MSSKVWLYSTIGGNGKVTHGDHGIIFAVDRGDAYQTARQNFINAYGFSPGSLTVEEITREEVRKMAIAVGLLRPLV